MSFNMKKKLCREFISECLYQLDEEYLVVWIDLPLEKAATEFQCNNDSLCSYEDFLDQCGSFIQHLYLNAFDIKKQLTDQQSIIETIAVIEEFYKGDPRERLDHAFLDAQEYGISHVFLAIVAHLKKTARDRHVRHLVNTKILPLKWAEKVVITRIIFDDWGKFLPPNLTTCKPDGYANQLPDLLLTLCSINQETHQLISKGPF